MTLTFTGNALDRASYHRSDAAWLAAAYGGAYILFLLVAASVVFRRD